MVSVSVSCLENPSLPSPVIDRLVHTDASMNERLEEFLKVRNMMKLTPV